MRTVPLQPVAAQVLKIILGGQNCTIGVYYKNGELFFDLNSGGVDIVTCVAMRNTALLVCIKYGGFVGNMMILDTQGASDPTYTRLGSRFQLLYLDEVDVNGII